MFASSSRQLLQRSFMSSTPTRAIATKHIGVIGAGQMGTGIGVVASRVAGLNVTMVDPYEASLQKSENFVKNWCAKEISKERLTQADSEDVLNRIAYSTELESLKSADFVIEAANEDFDIKKIIFQGLAKTVPDHAIMATNTSSISISKIGGIVPDRAH